jgi:elongation factor Ts
MPNLEKVKQLRNETGVSLNECRKAIQEANDDLEKAKDILKKKGQAVAAQKSGREAGEGIIDSYIHDNRKIGVLLALNCESDFVARSDDFKNLSKDICLQIAAMGPMYLKKEDVPQEVLDKEKVNFLEQIKDSSKPKEVLDKIVESKIESYFKETCLLSQPWIKDSSKTINDLVQETIVKIGENILVKRFTRYEL